ncbi:hypothetical protein F4778DRAFT_747760 [Xylariomycetidae sp. FL2044]|nr:hypothetical protein F4778DRAFT_747760 [Xylariomycetidae sp. FL2044]
MHIRFALVATAGCIISVRALNTRDQTCETFSPSTNGSDDYIILSMPESQDLGSPTFTEDIFANIPAPDGQDSSASFPLSLSYQFGPDSSLTLGDNQGIKEVVVTVFQVLDDVEQGCGVGTLVITKDDFRRTLSLGNFVEGDIRFRLKAARGTNDAVSWFNSNGGIVFQRGNCS